MHDCPLLFPFQTSTSDSAPSTPPVTRVKNKRYNTEHTLHPPNPLDNKSKRELSTSAPDLGPADAANEASPNNRFSVAAQSSALVLFDDMVEDPAEDSDMHIPHDVSTKEKGEEGNRTGKKAAEQESSSSSSAASEENTDQSHSAAPTT